MAVARETPGGQADPPRLVPLNRALLAEEAVGAGGGWLVATAAAATACRSQSGRDSHTRCSRTLTQDAINIQSPSLPARRPTAAPPHASLGTPLPIRSEGGGQPLPHFKVSDFLMGLRGCDEMGGSRGRWTRTPPGTDSLRPRERAGVTVACPFPLLHFSTRHTKTQPVNFMAAKTGCMLSLLEPGV